MYKALALLNDALQVRIDLFGDSHTDTAATLYRLGLLYEKMEDLSTAHLYISQAHKIYVENFPEENIRVQHTKNTLERLKI